MFLCAFLVVGLYWIQSQINKNNVKSSQCGVSLDLVSINHDAVNVMRSLSTYYIDILILWRKCDTTWHQHIHIVQLLTTWRNINPLRWKAAIFLSFLSVTIKCWRYIKWCLSVWCDEYFGISVICDLTRRDWPRSEVYDWSRWQSRPITCLKIHALQVCIWLEKRWHNINYTTETA